MAESNGNRALALIAGGLFAVAAEIVALNGAHAAERPLRKPVAHPRVIRTAERPLTIRRRARRPVVYAAAPSIVYAVRPHGWNDPRLYYFGPFRTGGEVFYGDQAGNPITRGNSELGRIAGYGPARGGFGGPHFDAVGGFHNGPGPDAKIDAAYASGSLSRPDYGDIAPRYPSVEARVATLNDGVVPRGDAITPVGDRVSRSRMTAEGHGSTAVFEDAKARFSAPMKHGDPESPVVIGQLPFEDIGEGL